MVVKRALLALVSIPALALPAAAQSQDATPEQVVNALEGTYGVHKGVRRNHAKGTCAEGTFEGSRDLARYSRSAIFAGTSVPVVARFSLSGGDPGASDAQRAVHGLGLELRLPDGTRQHFTMIDTPMFFARIPRTFLDRILAAKPDPKTGKPDPAALAAFAKGHPESAAQGAFVADHSPPPSYANLAVYGVHTFKFVAKDDAVTLVRWRFVPEDGEKTLSDAELASAPRDFLGPRLIERTQAGPVRWQMWVTIGRPGDAEDDPTVAWPKDREEVRAGTLTLTSASPSVKGSSCDPINYDPLIMADGIAPTNDPILLFRSPSYAVSFSRRLQDQP